MDDAHTQSRTITLPERVRIGQALHAHGLGHVRLPGVTTTERPCLGRQFGCLCGRCRKKPKAAPAAVIQPWDPRPLKHAA
jgi:hypothetical protein